MKFTMIALALGLTACGSSGGGAPGVTAAPSIVPTSPVTADLTLINGNGYQCFLDQGTVNVRAATLWCWGSNANLGLSSATPVAYITKNVMGFLPVAITNINAYSDLLCLQMFPNVSAYDGSQNISSYCFGKPAAVDDGLFGGEPVSRSPHPSPEITLAQAPTVGANLDWFSFSALTPVFPGNTPGANIVESCTVSGTTYTCPSVTLTLAP